MDKREHYFNKIQSDYIFSYLLSFFNLSDIRTIFILSKKFATILNKDNKKIIRDIQQKIFSTELNDKLILDTKRFKITSFLFNRSPILNSIILEHFLIASSCQFEPGFSVYDLNTNRLTQKIIFKEKNYSYVYSLMDIKEKKIILIGTNNGYIIAYYLNNNIFQDFWEYKTGLNKEIKNMIYYKLKEKFIIISLDSDDSINLNFLRLFYIEKNNEKYEDDNNNIKYIKSYIIKNVFIYKIKCFEKEIEYKERYICLGLSEGNISYNENKIDNTFKKDKIKNNELSILNINKIQLYFENNYEKNYDYLLKSNTYEELIFDFTLKGHKSYITDYLYLRNNNIILSVEYLSPYLFLWDFGSKILIKSILLPHNDSILCLLNISNKYISSAGRDRKIFIYSIIDLLQESSIIKKYEINCNHSSDIYKINFYQETHLNKLISSSFDKTIKIFCFKNYNFDKISKIILTGHSASICCVKIDSLRKKILTVDINCIINIWEYNESYKLYNIRKSIEINTVNGKKEFIDDIFLLYDNFNSIIKIDKTNKIKIFSLLKEEFIYEFSEDKLNILKILDLCNFSEFICYTSKNEMKIYNYRISKKKNAIVYEINKVKDINIDDNIINNKKDKITCFEMLSWKYKIVGIGYNNKKIVIVKFDIKFNYKQYCIDLNQDFNNINDNINISQIKSIDYTNKKKESKKNIECLLYIIFPKGNNFYIYCIQSDFRQLKIDFSNKIQFNHDINFLDILNKNIIISSFFNYNKIQIINLPNYEKEEKKEVSVDIIETTYDIINKILYISDNMVILFIANDSINYIQFNN